MRCLISFSNNWLFPTVVNFENLPQTASRFRQTFHCLQLSSHRERFRLHSRQKSQGKAKISAETIELIHKLARENRLWGAERIRGELLKLGMEVSKRTIQKYMPKDRKSHFSAVAASSGIQELKTLYRVPQANGVCERFMGSLRREYLDHMLIHDGRYLQLVVQEYTAYYNQERPHQGIGQRIPEPYALSKSKPTSGRIVTRAILGGLHHSYARATNLNYVTSYC